MKGFWRRAGAALLSAAVAAGGLSPGLSRAQEELSWIGHGDDGYASLHYGVPQSDYVLMSFVCDVETRTVNFTYLHEPADARDGIELDLLLQAGRTELPVSTNGMTLAIDDSFVLTGPLASADRLGELLADGTVLTVHVEGQAAEYPLGGALEAAAPLLKACADGMPRPLAGDINTCEIGAWSNDDDPNGLNVRAGPSSEHEVIAVLPPPRTVDGDIFRTEIEVTGSRDGWFRIRRASVVDYLGDEDDSKVFEGEGWVSGRHLGLLLNRRNLHAGPSSGTAIVAELFHEQDGSGPDSFHVDRLFGCTGHWVEVEASLGDRRHRGWTDGTCSNQVTTCP